MRALIFKDNAYKFINEQDEEDIYKFSGEGKRGMKLAKDGTFISFDSISRIESEQEFYERNPNLKPKSTPNYSSLPEPKQTYSDKKHKNRLENMRNGFLRGVAKVREVSSVSYSNLKEYQKATYDRMEKSLKALEGNDRFIMGRDNS